MEMRTRFAPSPTGFLHIGNFRTALFIYLAAKSLGGKFVLRVEDTDQKREVEGAVAGLLDILGWLGIHFDEGPSAGGRFGPYVQSQRRPIYDKYATELLDKGGAYRCFCTSERLEKMRADQQAKKLPPRYDRTCRHLTDEEIEEKMKAGEPYVIRQKIPEEGEIVVHDELRGDIRFDCADLDDHVLIKSDGMPTYQFASVVDDHTMEMTHVLRGDEWLSSFPKNILLYQAFGWQPPKFAHIPLILNKGGGKLSKRQGDVTVEDYRAKGYLPEAILNFCVLMGWHPKDENEILSLKEMEEKFRLEDIRISPAVFDLEKMDYFNGYYIRHKSWDELVSLCVPHLVADGLIEESGSGYKNLSTGEILSRQFLRGVAALEQERLKKLSDIGEATRFFFEKDLSYEPELLIWKKATAEEVKANLEKSLELLEKVPAEDWTKHSSKDAVVSHIEATGGRMGDYLWPLRVALTGRKASPGPFEVAEVLGKEKSLERLKRAIEKL